MKRRATIGDVAAQAGVSKGTVSFVLNGRAGVAPATRKRVLESMEALGWTPNQQARSLSKSRAFALGLVLARDPKLLGSDPFFAPFIAGVEAVLAPLGQAVLLRFVDGDDAEQAAYRSLAVEKRVDGVILSDLRKVDPRIELVAQLGMPAVTLNRPTGTSTLPAVCVDDRAGIAAAVDHLVESGHTRIAHVGGPARYLHAASRRRAWQTALRRHGLPAKDFVASDFTAAGGAAATRELLAHGKDRPTAVIYANDLMAISGMAVAQQSGLAVPDDLSVVGFDDAELSAFLHPALTTVRTDAFGFGRAAAEVLIAAIDGDSPADRVLPPAQLVARGSTAPPARPQKGKGHR